jgi:hypothetical protein
VARPDSNQGPVPSTGGPDDWGVRSTTTTAIAANVTTTGIVMAAATTPTPPSPQAPRTPPSANSDRIRVLLSIHRLPDEPITIDQLAVHLCRSLAPRMVSTRALDDGDAREIIEQLLLVAPLAMVRTDELGTAIERDRRGASRALEAVRTPQPAAAGRRSAQQLVRERLLVDPAGGHKDDGGAGRGEVDGLLEERGWEGRSDHGHLGRTASSTSCAIVRAPVRGRARAGARAGAEPARGGGPARAGTAHLELLDLVVVRARVGERARVHGRQHGRRVDDDALLHEAVETDVPPRPPVLAPSPACCAPVGG